MKLNIDHLSEAELLDLNRRIGERLRSLNQLRAHTHMLEFKLGSRVTFRPEGRPPVTGMLTRYNKKTVTVITEDGQHWNVSPSFLRKVDAEGTPDAARATSLQKSGGAGTHQEEEVRNVPGS